MNDKGVSPSVAIVFTPGIKLILSTQSKTSEDTTLLILQNELQRCLGRCPPNARAERQGGSSLHNFSSSVFMAGKKKARLTEDTWENPILLPQPVICGKFFVNASYLLRIT